MPQHLRTPPRQSLLNGSRLNIQDVIPPEQQAHNIASHSIPADLECLSDSSPPPQPEKHIPSPLEIQLASIQHNTNTNFDFVNKFFLALAKSRGWVDTKHIEVLMWSLGKKHSLVVHQEQADFVSPWLLSHLEAKSRSFKKAINKDLHRFDDQLWQFVLAPRRSWLLDVQTIYAPMNLQDRHWVGLAIHLQTKLIQGYYTNFQGGDCGPVAAKFMELHVNTVSDQRLWCFTDKMVDDFRKQWAMDIYKDVVIPLYFPPPQ
ncbi:unnamed protein product [Thlaspi arvense]|uniref:Ubiquitin-like protease family profile domain-containing protein n=1 Tax=Thlaspi arvense TaxID=13288 RepID=A0AAU9RYR3_THLAR|nr:unnamed protein product [Thlaspi arvense]